LEDLPPDLDLRSARVPLASAVAVAAGVFGADACAAAAESRETASDARRSLAPPSRSPATAGRCTHRPTPIAFLAFLHTPSIAGSTALTRPQIQLDPLLLEEDCEGDGARVLKGKGSRHWRAVAAVGWAGVAAGSGFWFDLCAARETGEEAEQ